MMLKSRKYAIPKPANLHMQGFLEQDIHFPPTFKFFAGTEQYNLKRIPSWTDRVLTLCSADPALCLLRCVRLQCTIGLRFDVVMPVGAARVRGADAVQCPTPSLYMLKYVQLQC